MVLQITHIGYTEDGKPKFEVSFLEDGTRDTAVVLLSPEEVQVVNHNINLRDGLKWYLEEYLDIAEGPYRNKADNICKALDKWGEECFESLFGNNQSRDWYQDALQDGLTNLNIKIESDDQRVLSWPWEAMKSRDEGYLALQCRMERQLSKSIESTFQFKTKQIEQLNILYVIARPFGVEDVGYCVLAKPLIDFIQEQKLPVHIDIMRPPTFDRLREVLRENPGFYHIVHFDGHGSNGKLYFEGTCSSIESGPGNAIDAKILGEALHEYNIPIMILNACRSAMFEEQVEDPFASVVVSLLRAGVQSVIAMSYNLYVAGAREFIPAFYQRLFESGNVADAMRAGRQKMYSNNGRNCFTGLESLRDWVVPVLYKQTTSDEGIIPSLVLEKVQESEDILPPEARSLDDYGFIGRDMEVQLLESTMRQPQAGVLIHGMAGEGKTTLVKGFLQWMAATHGVGEGVFWFSFEDIHSVGYIIDRMTDALFGLQAMAMNTEQKLGLLTKIFRESSYLLVWDNFESVSGIKGTEISALMSEEDRNLLKQLLYSLYNGKTKVLITSRSTESWLTSDECFKVILHGFQGEELWEYCNAVVKDFGLSVRRDNVYRKLMEKLEGNPLAVRAILLRLKEKNTEVLLNELEESFNGLEGDRGTARIQAALAVFEKGLDRQFAPILRLLGLHEHFVDIEYIGFMLEDTGYLGLQVLLEGCLETLECAGLCRQVDNNAYQIHPALRSCLTRLYPANEDDRRTFVDIMGQLANLYAPKELLEQRLLFVQHSANLYQALKLARDLDMHINIMALLQGLGTYADNIRNFSEAEHLYKELAETAKVYKEPKAEAVAYQRLGMDAQERRDFDNAEIWYWKSFAIKEQQDNEHGMALTYHQLGMVAHERKNFGTAEELYKKALALELKLNDHHNAALTYFQMGKVALDQKYFDIAEEFYRKSLDINMKLIDEYGMALNYHQMGIIAHERKEYYEAEKWYRKALAIDLKQDNEDGIASTYHQLGKIAYEHRDYDNAEELLDNALVITLKLRDKYKEAIVYNTLGEVAKQRKDFGAAKEWYEKSLEVFEKLGDEYYIKVVKHNLNIISNTN